MEKLLMLLSATVTREQLFSDLRDMLDMAIADPEDTNVNDKVLLLCELIMMNRLTKGTLEGAQELMDGYERYQEREKLFEIPKN